MCTLVFSCDFTGVKISRLLDGREYLLLGKIRSWKDKVNISSCKYSLILFINITSDFLTEIKIGMDFSKWKLFYPTVIIIYSY